MVANSLTDLALTGHPALCRKLAAFRADYQITDKPALVWQCRPMTSIEVDVKSTGLKEALSKGAVPGSDSAWWCAFRSGQQPTLVFDGLASSRDAEGQGWVAETHTDGHIVTGLWTFPDVPIGDARSPCVSTFHGQAFTDFGTLAANLLEAAAYEGQCEMTCTLLRASQLPFVLESNRYHPQPRRLRRDELQWRIRPCQGADAIRAVAALMAEDFLRAYGFSTQ
jgi:hypothetical protein